jgi:UDP-N-acetylglucosamine 2-epimerase (non-hydrolysing)
MAEAREPTISGLPSSARSLCACVVGTRPEVIKMAPVIKRLQQTEWARPWVVAVGQHTQLLDLAIADFDIGIDDRIEIVRSRHSVLEVLTRAIDGLDERLSGVDPQCVLAQGDTTTVLASALVAFHRRIPFVHVEAGLRTGALSAPFPEEFNRRVTAIATWLHCAPTASAMNTLIAEGVPRSDCIVSGNTVIDALLEMEARNPPLPKNFPIADKPILLTAHRRESFGAPLRRALTALREAVDRYSDTAIFFPVHPNPSSHRVAMEIFESHPQVALTEPVKYSELVAAMKASWLVVTDSGGLQEEAPALGKPVLVLREVTERPEALETGVVKLVGTDPERIKSAIAELHDNPDAYRRAARPVFPYGDGHAAVRIVDAMRAALSTSPPSAFPAGDQTREALGDVDIN